MTVFHVAKNTNYTVMSNHHYELAIKVLTNAHSRYILSLLSFGGVAMTHSKYAARYISKLSNKLRRKIDAFSSRENLSGSQGRVLHFLLAQTGDVFQKDIEEEYSLRPPTATELLKKMERDGLIHREAMPNDARMKRIIVSEKALQYRDVVVADITHLEDELTRGISSADMDTFFSVIEKMLDNIS